MKKTVIIISSILLVIIISFTIYWNLPIEITRKSDIDFGNKLVSNIENYKKINHKLPESEDWKTLKKLGFKKKDSGIQPDYQTDSLSFELIYIDEFDGPYLLWNSQERKWTIDYPKVYKK